MLSAPGLPSAAIARVCGIQFNSSAVHAGDELLLDAAADVIAACSGLLACGGKVSTNTLQRYSAQ